MRLRSISLLLFVVFSTVTGWGQQADVLFSNRPFGFPSPANRYVYATGPIGPGDATDAARRLIGSNYCAGLWYVAGAGNAAQLATGRGGTQVGTFCNFQSNGPLDVNNGTWIPPQPLQAPLFKFLGVPPGGSVTLQVRVWNYVAYGRSEAGYLASLATGSGVGYSAPFNYTVPVAGSTPDRYYMDGLRAFVLLPEPSTQPVYSDNIVGFYHKTLPTGLSMFANQLNATPNNRVTTLIPTSPGSITISKFNPATGSFESALFDQDAGGWNDPSNMILNPGQGAFMDNASGAPLPLTFLGEVQLISTVNVHTGLDVYSSVIPQAGTLSELGFSCVVSVFKFNGSAFDTYVYDPDAGGWSPSEPRLEIGESFWVDNAVAAAVCSWSRNFPVGP